MGCTLAVAAAEWTMALHTAWAAGAVVTVLCSFHSGNASGNTGPEVVGRLRRLKRLKLRKWRRSPLQKDTF